jgi:hypothetical protein
MRCSAEHLSFRQILFPDSPSPGCETKKDPSLAHTVIHARERNAPRDRDPIRWHLITNLEVTSLQSAVDKRNWHAQRWQIETYHKILKSGCAAEKSKLHTAERLTNLLAVLWIIA